MLSVHRNKKADGFTLVEIMVVAGIMGIMSLIAIPSYSKMREAVKVEGFVTHLEAIEQSLKLCAILNRGYPPNVYPATIPEGGVEKHLPREFDWTVETPLGGHWNWDAEAKTQWGCFFEYGISVSSVDSPVLSETLFQRVDSRIDDGDLNTGAFRKIGNQWHQYSYSFQLDTDSPWGTMH